MNYLSWVDNRTVVACQCLLAAILTLVLLGVRRLYPQLRGVGTMALGFFLAVIAIVLVTLGTAVPRTILVLVAVALEFIYYNLFYRAILRFCQAEAEKVEDKAHEQAARRAAEGYPRLLYAVSAVAYVALALLIHTRYLALVQVGGVTFTLVLASVLMAAALLRGAAGRWSMRLFAWSLLLTSALSLYDSTMTLVAGSAGAGVAQVHFIRSLTLLVSLLSLCIDGIFYLAMLTDAIAADIQRQAAAEAELAVREQRLESEERLRFMAESMPQKVFTTRPDGSADYHNREWETFSGLSNTELAEWSWARLIHPDDLEDNLRRWKHCIATATPFEGEQRFRARDGSYRWHLSRAHPMRSAQGEIVMWMGSSTDIQDQKLAEAALRKSEKLAVAGRLAASISHEINNPLEAVMNLLYLIRTEEQHGTIVDYARAAEDELARVAHIVTHTLQFHRQPTAATEEKICTLLRATVGLYSGRLNSSSIQLKSKFSDEITVHCFPAELRQVFANLLGNAFDATRTGGIIYLRSRYATDPRTGQIGVRVTIADTGCGMDANTRKHLFEPFFTTKGNNGTGLGLWISAEILSRHHSSMQVRSSQTNGRSGTVFSMFFPQQTSVAPSAIFSGEELLELA